MKLSEGLREARRLVEKEEACNIYYALEKIYLAPARQKWLEAMMAVVGTDFEPECKKERLELLDCAIEETERRRR